MILGWCLERQVSTYFSFELGLRMSQKQIVRLSLMSTILSNISRSNSFWTICLLEYLDTVWWTPWFDSRRIGLPTTVSELPEKVIKENLSSKTIAITHIHAHKLEKTRTDMALRAKKACGIRDLDMTSMVTFFNDGREFQVSEKNVRVRLASL